MSIDRRREEPQEDGPEKRRPRIVPTAVGASRQDLAREDAVPEGLPGSYALALCRIEPENSVHIILETFSKLDTPLVFVGKWANNACGQELKSRHGARRNLHLLDPVYDPGALYAFRTRTSVYVHGHSAGGTNPALVEVLEVARRRYTWDHLGEACFALLENNQPK